MFKTVILVKISKRRNLLKGKNLKKYFRLKLQFYKIYSENFLLIKKMSEKIDILIILCKKKFYCKLI